MKIYMWKRAAVIGVTFGMLISGMPISAYADEISVEEDSFSIVEAEALSVTHGETFVTIRRLKPEKAFFILTHDLWVPSLNHALVTSFGLGHPTHPLWYFVHS